ncbi:MAG: response regulator transcription factor [Bacteroidales bacterium]|nr:response regulator transcription factor [Bacteroidales bacterium]
MMENNNIKILLVDDEADILEFLSYNLKKQGYQIFTAKNGKQALIKAKEIIPHLVLLDIMMPEIDGIEACEQIRKIDTLNNTLIAFLTARGEDYSQIAGFEAGADDYISKPIKPKVLVSRIKALLKRHNDYKLDLRIDNQKIIKNGNILIDKNNYKVTVNNEIVNLTKKEFYLLLLLISKPEKVFTRDEIFSSVWGENVVVGDRTIDVHIKKLREKIGDEHIVTIKGFGYKFV